ncbi:hypothetical protein PCASD_16040 [Puccinia coronata f. sp. avenae]|uniref:Uncharacterized protein n=1 Tax=Puccinia coronata f. sp. avenae TaxID=200324 RepID=A0A2N5U019_9BASI|nr:hypothetical protein PCASD_16040 [Puccinia coronata f. sp. avenae]
MLWVTCLVPQLLQCQLDQLAHLLLLLAEPGKGETDVEPASEQQRSAHEHQLELLDGLEHSQLDAALQTHLHLLEVARCQVSFPVLSRSLIASSTISSDQLLLDTFWFSSSAWVDFEIITSLTWLSALPALTARTAVFDRLMPAVPRDRRR